MFLVGQKEANKTMNKLPYIITIKGAPLGAGEVCTDLVGDSVEINGDTYRIVSFHIDGTSEYELVFRSNDSEDES